MIIDTPFHNGQFKIKLSIGDNFPTSPPTGHFQTKIFHPNVAVDGEICVSTLKKDWDPSVTISKLFLVLLLLIDHQMLINLPKS